MDQLPDRMASDIVIDGCMVLEGGAFRGLYGPTEITCWNRPLHRCRQSAMPASLPSSALQDDDFSNVLRLVTIV